MQVHQYFIHPQFDIQTYNLDVRSIFNNYSASQKKLFDEIIYFIKSWDSFQAAVIRTIQPMVGRDVRPIPLISMGTFIRVGSIGTISGWGYNVFFIILKYQIIFYLPITFRSSVLCQPSYKSLTFPCGSKDVAMKNGSEISDRSDFLNLLQVPLNWFFYRLFQHVLRGWNRGLWQVIFSSFWLNWNLIFVFFSAVMATQASC